MAAIAVVFRALIGWPLMLTVVMVTTALCSLIKDEIAGMVELVILTMLSVIPAAAFTWPSLTEVASVVKSIPVVVEVVRRSEVS